MTYRHITIYKYDKRGAINNYDTKKKKNIYYKNFFLSKLIIFKIIINIKTQFCLLLKFQIIFS